MFQKLIATALTLCAATGFAEVVTIEGFENTDDLANWQVNLTATHTHNATVTGNVPLFVSTNVTEGSLAGQFNATWSDAPTAATANPFDSAGPLTYWGIRYNINAPGSLPNNSIPTATGILEADLTNESPYPVQVALVVDSLASSQLERGPYVVVDANSTATYSWEFATQPPVGFDTGDGAFSGDTQRVKSLLVYSPTAPTATAFSVTVDNIRNNSVADITPPATPEPLSLRQGPNPGEARMTWVGTSDPDLASYNIYVSGDANFGTPVTNRLEFPSSPVETVAGTENSVTLTGLPIGENVYVAISAIDSAPVPNESPMSRVFAVRLAADGSFPLDILVLDHDEFQPAEPGFVANGYFHAAVYTAQALDELDRTFGTYSATAVATSHVSLTPNPAGVVIWSNLMDGASVDSGSINATNLTRIENFITAEGNIIISGSAVAEDLGATDLQNVLKATLVNANIGIGSVTPVSALAATGTFSTTLNPATNVVAFGTTANDGILPALGSIKLAEYTGIPATGSVAGIGFEDSLVFFGFAFESAGSTSGATASVLVRQNLMATSINYLLSETAARDWNLFD